MSAAPSVTSPDELFDDVSFSASRRILSPAYKPKMWPKSTSQMRGHTSYQGEGMDQDQLESKQFAFVTKRPVTKLVKNTKMRSMVPRTTAPQPLTQLQILRLKAARRRLAAKARATADNAPPISATRKWTWFDTSAR